MNIVANKATDMRQMATAMVVVAVIARETESFLSVVAPSKLVYTSEMAVSAEANSVPGTLLLPAGELFLHPPVRQFTSTSIYLNSIRFFAKWLQRLFFEMSDKKKYKYKSWEGLSNQSHRFPGRRDNTPRPGHPSRYPCNKARTGCSICPGAGGASKRRNWISRNRCTFDNPGGNSCTTASENRSTAHRGIPCTNRPRASSGVGKTCIPSAPRLRNKLIPWRVSQMIDEI